jgi:hypothetical protein
MAYKTVGYGRFQVGVGKCVQAHRWSYEQLIGPIPQGLVLDHLCRTPACVNPAHLEPVTSSTNVKRGEVGLRHRSKTHCPQGHEYSAENTYVHRGTNRHCRACLRGRNREYHRQHRQELYDRYKEQKAARRKAKAQPSSSA